MRMYAQMGNEATPIPVDATLTLNSSSPVIRSLAEKDADKAEIIAKQVYNLCVLTQGYLIRTADRRQSVPFLL